MFLTSPCHVELGTGWKIHRAVACRWGFIVRPDGVSSMNTTTENTEAGSRDRGRLVTVFGGTGFLGRRIVRHLLDRGFAVRAASRHPDRVQSLFKSDGPVPQAVAADAHDDASLASALAGAYGAVNAISLYVEHGRETFHAVHIDAAARIAGCAREAGVERLVHVSGIGADASSSSPYIRARGRGELAVTTAFAGAIVVRPAVMFGPDDVFLTSLAKLVRTVPLYPGRKAQPCGIVR
jgi:uncharacterized protein YbjT (DUF2867 family)